MKLKRRRRKIYGTAFGAMMAAGILVPTHASADEGVLLKDVQAKNGETVIELKKGERVNWSESTESGYMIEQDYIQYELDKLTVLHTETNDKSSYEIKKGAVLYIEPKPSSIAIGEVREGVSFDEEEILNTEPGWYQIQLPEGLVGWVSSEEVNEVRSGEQVKTTAFAKEDVHGMKYRDEIQVVDFDGIHYTVLKADGSTVQLKEKEISFTKPEPRIVHTPPVYTSTSNNGQTAAVPATGSEQNRTQTAQPGKSSQAQALTDSGVHSGDRFSQLINYAKLELGKPYVWGGNGEVGFDCSGYTTQMFKKIGINLPRTAATQAQLGTKVTDLQVGDLLFYSTYKAGPSHVSIYMGDGKIIHAAGKQVHIADINSSYWKERFLYAKRVR